MIGIRWRRGPETVQGRSPAGVSGPLHAGISLPPRGASRRLQWGSAPRLSSLSLRFHRDAGCDVSVRAAIRRGSGKPWNRRRTEPASQAGLTGRRTGRWRRRCWARTRPTKRKVGSARTGFMAAATCSAAASATTRFSAIPATISSAERAMTAAWRFRLRNYCP